MARVSLYGRTHKRLAKHWILYCNTSYGKSDPTYFGYFLWSVKCLRIKAAKRIANITGTG